MDKDNRTGSFIMRIASGAKRRLDPTDKGRVKRIMKNPPAVRQDSIVFTSSDDYTGNPKALFLYMIDHGYNRKYKITWLFEKKENFFNFDIPNVSSVLIWNKRGERTPAAQKAIMSARYIFYSHNVNWCRKYSEEQDFINLWHGCGYKADMKSDKKKIYYDHLIVTGSKYIDIFRKVLKNPDGNILDLGYPRNESLFSCRSQAGKVIDSMKRNSGADKAIIWMPTYRTSRLARLNTDTGLGETGLPLLNDDKDIAELDKLCHEKGVLSIRKQHFLAADFKPGRNDYKNIVFVDEQFLREREADLYELMGHTDALLTDYSSVAIDYMLLDKPIGYSLDDFDRYEDARGWSFDNVKEYMPGHHIYSKEDLAAFISDISEGKDLCRDRRTEILKEVQTYRDGFSKRILDYFGI